MRLDYFPKFLRENDPDRVIENITAKLSEINASVENLIDKLKTLWNLSECPPEYLDYISHFLALFEELNLSDAEKRTLLSTLVELWQKKGTKVSLETLLYFMNSEYPLIFDWKRRIQNLPQQLPLFAIGEKETKLDEFITYIDTSRANIDVLQIFRVVGEEFYLRFPDLYDDFYQQKDVWTFEDAYIKDKILYVETYAFTNRDMPKNFWVLMKVKNDFRFVYRLKNHDFLKFQIEDNNLKWYDKDVLINSASIAKLDWNFFQVQIKDDFHKVYWNGALIFDQKYTAYDKGKISIEAISTNVVEVEFIKLFEYPLAYRLIE